MARKIEVQIVGDASSFHRALGLATSRSNKFGSVLSGGLKVGAVGAGIAITGLGYALKRGIDDFNESQKVAAQTRAVLKSTGGAAGVTAKHVNQLANSLSQMSGVDDEAIGSSENLLLTFRNIHNQVGKNNDIFDQATKATLDLSVSMGTDLHSASILVGKALNDPVKGMTALRRVGVSLSDSQEKLIKHLDDTGQRAKAQKIILGELRKEFGGSAKAAGETLSGQLNKLRNAFDNAASSVIQGLLPYLVRLAQFAFPLAVSAIKIVVGGIKVAIKWVEDFASHFEILGSKSESGSDRVRNAFDGIMNFLRGNVFPIIRRLRSVFEESMSAIAKVVQKDGPELKRIFDRVGSAIKAVANVAIPIIKFALTTILPKAIDITIKVLDKLTFVIGKVADIIKWIGNHAKDAFNTLKKAVSAVASVIDQIASPILSALGKIKDIMEWIISHIPDIPSPSDLLGSAQLPRSRGGSGGASNPTASRGGGNAPVAQFNLHLDGKLFYSAMVKADKDVRRQNGRSLLAGT